MNALDSIPRRNQTTLPLPRAAAGSTVIVTGVTAEEHAGARLRRLGICEGRRLRVWRNGDPLVVRVAGTRLGLSALLAQHVLVQPCPGRGTCSGETP